MTRPDFRSSGPWSSTCTSCIYDLASDSESHQVTVGPGVRPPQARGLRARLRLPTGRHGCAAARGRGPWCVAWERRVHCPAAGSRPGSRPAGIGPGHSGWGLSSDSPSWLRFNLKSDSEGGLRSESGSRYLCRLIQNDDSVSPSRWSAKINL